MFLPQEDIPVDGANAYGNVTGFRAYHELRARPIPVATYPDAQVETALVLATDYLDTRFDFVGYRDVRGQTTQWPRNSAYDDRGDAVEGIPIQVIEATYEYALRALTATLFADPDRDSSGREVASKSEGVGPLKESVTYANEGRTLTLPEYPAADRKLYAARLVKRTGGLQSHALRRG